MQRNGLSVRSDGFVSIIACSVAVIAVRAVVLVVAKVVRILSEYLLLIRILLEGLMELALATLAHV